MKKLAILISLVLVWPGVVFPAKSADNSMASQIEIPFEKFVLPNGLTLIVHEDHKAPIVGVNVWYHVGSKNEKPGRTGFAHLFEHLMFNGTEHWPGEFFEPLEEVGATGMNGTTNADRTNYFENVPTNALDLALWLESDRMGHMQGAITKEKLDEQRGVVQNEKRQGENQPYGRTWTLLTENTYPAGHPYSWTTIGSMEDLDAAELDGRQGVVQDLLRRRQRGAFRRRRRRRPRGEEEGRALLRRHPFRSPGGQAGSLGRQDDGDPPPADAGPRPPGPDLPGLERAPVGYPGSGDFGPGGPDPGAGQDLAALQAAGLQGPDRHGRVGLRLLTRTRRPIPNDLHGPPVQDAG